MNRPQHTPGPWRIYQERPHYYSIGTDYAHDRGHDSNVVRDVRNEANARLIAAAPEMLEALEGIIDSARDGRDIPEWLDERLVSAEAAIRKARGAV